MLRRREGTQHNEDSQGKAEPTAPKSAALTDSVGTEPTTAVTLRGRRAKEANGLASRARHPEEAISETVGWHAARERYSDPL